MLADELVARAAGRPATRAGRRAPLRRCPPRRGCRARPTRGGRCPSGSRSRAPAVAFEWRARRQAGERLQRLEARARQNRGRPVSPSCGDHRAVGVEDDGRSRVARLDETAAFDDGELDGVGCGEGLRHDASLPPPDPRIPACQTGRMLGEHRYAVRTTWTGDRGTGTTGYRDYDRVGDDRDRGQARRCAASSRQALPRRSVTMESRGPPARGAQRVPPAVVPARVREGGVVVVAYGTRHPASWSRTAAAAAPSERSSCGRA